MEKRKKSQMNDPIPELGMLPIFYLFPKELLNVSEFKEFPRNPHLVRNSPKWMATYRSGKFLEAVVDGTAKLVWRHFGIKAKQESTFTGYFPPWMLARLGDWQRIAAQFGFNTYSMGKVSEAFRYPVLTYESADSIFGRFVQEFRNQFPLDDWLKTVQEMPTHEDFIPSPSNMRYVDFCRRWYHTRSITKTAFVGEKEDWDDLPKTASDPWKEVNSRLDFEEFCESLSTVDCQIMEWLDYGCTQTEVAKILGYTNPSAVSKRVKRTREKAEHYFSENLRKPPAKGKAANNWDEMTQLLFPKAKPKPTS